MAYLTPAQVGDRVPELEGQDPVLVADLVDEFEATAEDYRGVAYTPRTATDTVRIGTHGEAVLAWPYVRSITSITIDGTAWTSDQVEAVDLDGVAGIVRCLYGCRAVVVYEHGMDGYDDPDDLYPPPRSVLRACVEFVRSKVNRSTTERGSIDYTQQDDASGNTYSFLTADKANGRPTGLPEVDAILNALPDHRTPGIA